MPMQTDRQSKVVFRIPSTSTHLSALLAVRNASFVRPFLFLVLIFVYILYLSLNLCSCSVIETLLLYSLSAVLSITYTSAMSICHDAALPLPDNFLTFRHSYHFYDTSGVFDDAPRLLFLPIYIKSTHSWFSITRIPQRTHETMYIPIHPHSFSISPHPGP